VIVGVGEFEGPARVRRGARHISPRLCDRGAVGEDHPGNHAEDLALRARVPGERAFRGVQVGIDAVEITAHYTGADEVNGKSWPRADHVIWKGVEPAADCRLFAVPERRGSRKLDKFSGARRVLAQQRMADGRWQVSVALVPVARPTVERRDGVGRLVAQPRGQHVGKEVVVAVPATLVVERHHEQVGALEGFEHRGAVRITRECITQRAG